MINHDVALRMAVQENTFAVYLSVDCDRCVFIKECPKLGTYNEIIGNILDSR